MTRRFITVLVFAFLVAGGISFLFYRFMTEHTATKDVPAATRVVVASRDLQVGTLLKDGDVHLADLTGSLPAGVALKEDAVLGRGVIAEIYANEPIIGTRLAQKGAGAGLAALIPNGMRAVAVRVNEIIGVAGFAVPGMKVDVIVSGTPVNNPTNGTVSRTILQNIEVLSAGQNFQKDLEGKPVSVQVVNLLVDPSQAETLSLAGSQNSLQLVLRNPMDTSVAKTTGAETSVLFGGLASNHPATVPVVRRVAPPPAPAPPPRPDVVEVFQGVKRADVSFPESGGSH
jgi:pilus assembly protein CpaB